MVDRGGSGVVVAGLGGLRGFAEQRDCRELDPIDRLLEEDGRRVVGDRAATALRETPGHVVLMEFFVGGPDVYADPAGSVLTASAKPGPVKELAAEALTGEPAADGYAPDVDGWLTPVGRRPDPVVVRAGSQRGSRPGLIIQGDPGSACLDRPPDVRVASVLIRPGNRPLVGVLRPQPPRRLLQEAANCVEVVGAGPAENEQR